MFLNAVALLVLIKFKIFSLFQLIGILTDECVHLLVFLVDSIVTYKFQISHYIYALLGDYKENNQRKEQGNPF